MSYSRTVNCSYCYERGHNRRSCPHLKAYVENNPDSYRAKREKERRLRMKNRVRRCSYCDGVEHNARTCTIKKEDKKRLVLALSVERKRFFEKMKAQGIGVGALFARDTGWNMPKLAYMISGINWKNCHGGEHFSFVAMNVAKASGNHEWDYHAPKTVHHTIRTNETWEALLCPANTINAPQEWLDGTLYDEEQWFPKSTQRCQWAYRLEDGEELHF